MKKNKRIDVFDDFRYHQLCARQTLYPNKSYEEVVKVIEKQIQKIIQYINVIGKTEMAG